jgi:hypothetical protein
VSSVDYHDLLRAGLLESEPKPRLTAKGRDWLRTLEGLHTEEVMESHFDWQDGIIPPAADPRHAVTGASDEDFVRSTSGLFR